jgi:integrase
MGAIYRRPNSPFLWIKYYVNGRPVRESTGTAKEKEAEQFLKRREGAAAEGKPVFHRIDRVRYEELAADLRRYYATTGKRDKVESETRLTHLDRFFARVRVADITPALIARYVEQRQAAPAANGTINRELAVLSRMLRLGYKHGKVLRWPVIEKLTEAPPRAGFFEEHQYEAVRRQLPDDLQVATAIMYVYGWRVGEVLTREWRHVDLQAETLRLEPGETKNGDGRLVYLTDELKALLTAQRGRVDALQRQLGRIIPWVFPHFVSCGWHHAGDRRKNYRRAWVAACKAAGVPGRLRHDFRRTAVRNLERRAVARSVAMKITGHKTESVYRRYAIVSDADLQEATRKLTGTFSGTQRTARENPAPQVARI